MQHSEWIAPTTEELHELEVTQIDEKKGDPINVPINSGMWVILLFVIIFGLWKQYRISRFSTSES